MHSAKIKRLQKFWDFRDILKWSVNETLGWLGNLWGEVIEIREDGNIGDWRPTYLAQLTNAAAEPEKLYQAALDTGWIEKHPSGAVLIHDWLDYAGPYLRSKYASKKWGLTRLAKIWVLHGRNYGDKGRPVSQETPRQHPGNQQSIAPTHPPNHPPNHPPSGRRAAQERVPEAVQAAERLRGLIQANDAGAKIPADLGKWVLEAEKLIRIDKRPLDEILRVMEWALTDDFWKSNILSMRKLREQFTRLKIKAPSANGSLADSKCPACNLSGQDFKPVHKMPNGDIICQRCKDEFDAKAEVSDGEKPLPKFKKLKTVRRKSTTRRQHDRR